MSEDAIGLYGGTILNSRYHYEDNGQFISSTGLGLRAMCPQSEIIAGLNAFWDSIHSARTGKVKKRAPAGFPIE